MRKFKKGDIGIPRKAWTLMAKHQLLKRQSIFGEQANVCEGCLEILMCSGPVSFGVCQAVERLQASGHITGPKKIPFAKLRRKTLPASKECLLAYGFHIEGNKLVRERHR